ncbi:MAG: diguanylate cyclase [Thermoanaerobaculia bacterium]
MPTSRPALTEGALALLAVVFGVGLLRARRRERRSAERFREMENLAHAFAEAPDAGGIAACAHEAVTHLAPLERFELYLFDQDDRVREIWESARDDPADPPRPADSHPRIRSAFQREHLDRLTGTETSHSFAPLHLQVPPKGRKKFNLPLYSGSHPVGYWELEFARSLSGADLDRLRATYRSLASAVASERNFRLAARDALSGLFARRYFDARLRKEASRVGRYNRSLSVAAFDLDRFKALNDVHGHAAGDEAIRLFARILQDELREQDICGRRGGEEFAAYFPETPVEAAQGVCERIRARFESAPFRWEDRPLSLTVSVGVTQVAPAEPIETVLERADAALYQAKEHGRNRVIVIS